MSRFLVTGAAGFIGSHVSAQLLSSGHAVIGLDNLNDAYDVRLKRYRLERLLTNRGFLFEQIDVRNSKTVANPSALASALSVPDLGRIDSIVHLAARAGIRQSLQWPKEYLTSNVNGTLNPDLLT